MQRVQHEQHVSRGSGRATAHEEVCKNKSTTLTFWSFICSHALHIHNGKNLLNFNRESSKVVNLRETFEDENFVYMVMELCQGGELAPLATNSRESCGGKE